MCSVFHFSHVLYILAVNTLSAQVLLSASANQHAVDSEGGTALDYAGLLEDGADMVTLLSSVGVSGTFTGSSFLHI